MGSPPRERYEFLDAVRGLAALTVFFAHYIAAFGLPASIDKAISGNPLHFWFDGFAAVSMFFVLSGLVLSLKFFSSAPGDWAGLLPAFYVQRAFRLYAPFLVMTLASLALRRFFLPDHVTIPAQTEWLRQFWRHPIPSSVLLESATLYSFPGPDLSVIPQAWTLTLELGLSILVPIGALLARKNDLAAVAACMVGIAFAGLSPLAFHFVLGILIGKHLPVLVRVLRASRRAPRLLLCAVGFFFYSFRYGLPLRVEDPRLRSDILIWYATGIGSALFLLSAFGSSLLRRVLTTQVLDYLGRISYSFYLCHMAVFIAFTPYALWQMNQHGVTRWGACWIAGGVLSLAVSVGFSHLMREYVELPSIRYGKAVSARLGRSPRLARETRPDEAHERGGGPT